MNYRNVKVGEKAVVLIGPMVGDTCKVIEIEFNAGARNGWFTVEFDKDQESGLYAGEELRFLGEK